MSASLLSLLLATVGNLHLTDDIPIIRFGDDACTLSMRNGKLVSSCPIEVRPDSGGGTDSESDSNSIDGSDNSGDGSSTQEAVTVGGATVDGKTVDQLGKSAVAQVGELSMVVADPADGTTRRRALMSTPAHLTDALRRFASSHQELASHGRNHSAESRRKLQSIDPGTFPLNSDYARAKTRCTEPFIT